NSAGLARLGRAEACNELLVRRHDFHAARDDVAHTRDQLDDLLLGNQVDRGVIAVWHEVLSHHDLHPARKGEHLVGVAEEAAAVAEQADVVGELLRNLHGPAVLPERRVAPLGREVVQDQEVADALELERRLLVVTLDHNGTEIALRHQIDQPPDTGLDEVDARRLERLHETAGQAYRHAVAVPELPAPTGGEFEDPRLRERAAVEVAHQRAVHFVVADVLARIDVAVAGAVLQRYAPLPPG